METKHQLISLILLATLAASPAFSQEYEFKGGFPTLETARRVQDEQDYQRAIQAYRFFYPTVSMAGTFQGTREAGAEDNKSALMLACGPRHVLFTGNSDTPYMGGVLNLKQTGPVVIDLPAGPYLGIINDHHFRWVHDVGLPGDDAGKGVAYPLAADNVARPLVSRLKGPQQPVIRSRIRFSAPRSRLLARL